jgi:hypothetical protein
MRWRFGFGSTVVEYLVLANVFNRLIDKKEYPVRIRVLQIPEIHF